jgi:hypothetical protein
MLKSAPRTPPAAPSAARRLLAVAAFAAMIALAVRLDRESRGEVLEEADGLGFRMSEVAAEVGLTFEHRVAAIDPKVAHVADHIMAVGAACAASDVNGDGAVDLYVTSSDFGAPNALFINDGTGNFTDRAAELGVADLNLPGRGVSMGSVFGDYDNDGDEDLFLYRFGYLALLRNDGDAGFVEVTRAAGLERWANSNGAIWFDYDRDGLLDLYVLGYYGAEHDLWNLTTTRIMHDSGEFATNGAPNWMFRNNGDGTFEDVTARVGLEDGEQLNRKWSYAALAADLDRDGWPDLYVANDYGSEQLFRNVEGARFELVEADLEHDSKSGMSVAVGNVRNDGRWSVFITNISEPGYIFHGNNLRENRLTDAGRLVQTAKGALLDTGWAWSAQFGDLDLDGQQDLVVANGFISADPDRSYWYDAGKLSGGIGGLLADAANWSPINGRSQSGYQRTAVLHNQGRGAYANVSVAAGIEDLYDGRAVVLADIDNDGDLDLVIANQKAPLVCYRNQVDGEPSWIGFDLVARRSNRSAIGAEVELEFDGQRQLQVVTGGSGFSSQNDRRLHFGLGQAPRDLRAVIRWPSGVRQVLENLEPGSYVRVEESLGSDSAAEPSADRP